MLRLQHVVELAWRQNRELLHVLTDIEEVFVTSHANIRAEGEGSPPISSGSPRAKTRSGSRSATLLNGHGRAGELRT